MNRNVYIYIYIFTCAHIFRDVKTDLFSRFYFLRIYIYISMHIFLSMIYCFGKIYGLNQNGTVNNAELLYIYILKLYFLTCILKLNVSHSITLNIHIYVRCSVLCMYIYIYNYLVACLNCIYTYIILNLLYI